VLWLVLVAGQDVEKLRAFLGDQAAHLVASDHSRHGTSSSGVVPPESFARPPLVPTAEWTHTFGGFPASVSPDATGVGSEQAFRRYVVPEIEVLLRVARSITRHQHDAEDLVQDTLLRAYRAIDRFDGSNPRAWLLTILRNAHLNQARRRRPALLREPEQEHVARLLDGHLEAAIRTLPEKFRRAVELVDLAGLSYEEAAQVLDVPVGTVMSRVHRGRARLREHLRPGSAKRSEVRR